MRSEQHRPCDVIIFHSRWGIDPCRRVGVTPQLRPPDFRATLGSRKKVSSAAIIVRSSDARKLDVLSYWACSGTRSHPITIRDEHLAILGCRRRDDNLPTSRDAYPS